MPETTTLGALVEQHFAGKLVVANIGDMKIVITNDPDFEAARFSVTAVASRSTNPLLGNDAHALEVVKLVPSRPCSIGWSANTFWRPSSVTGGSRAPPRRPDFP